MSGPLVLNLLAATLGPAALVLAGAGLGCDQGFAPGGVSHSLLICCTTEALKPIKAVTLSTDPPGHVGLKLQLRLFLILGFRISSGDQLNAVC